MSRFRNAPTTGATSSRRRSRGSAGVTLVETLVAVVILGAVVGGIAASTITSTKVASGARQRSAVNALLTSFGEAIKALPYTICAAPAAYQNGFEFSDGIGATNGTAIPALAGSGETLTVVSVEDNLPGGTHCPDSDSGTQVVTISATKGAISVSGKITKRSPRPEELPPTFNFSAANITGTNATFAAFRIDPDFNISNGIARIEYWCNPSWVALAADLPRADLSTDGRIAKTVTTPAVLPQPRTSLTGDMQCGPTIAPEDEVQSGVNPWQAPVGAPGGGNLRTIAIRAVGYGVTYPIIAKSVMVPTTTFGVGLPIASFDVLHTPTCTVPNECSAPLTLQFDPTRSVAAEGTSFVRCRWTFGPDVEPVVVAGNECASSANIVTQDFPGSTGSQGTEVTLTVTDNFGRAGFASTRIHLNGTPARRPGLTVAATVNGTTFNEPAASNGVPVQLQVESVAPQRVYFKATATPFDGKTIQSITWTFGTTTKVQMGSTAVDFKWEQAAVTPACADGKPGHIAKVTVLDSAGLSTTKRVCVVLRALGYYPGSTSANSTMAIDVAARDIYTKIISWRLEVTFAWVALLLPPAANPADFKIQIQTQENDGAASCFLSNSTKDIPLTALDQTQGKVTFNDYLAVGSADGCQFRARVVRRYEGVDIESDWTPFKSYNNGIPVKLHWG